jgi:hypothetical protein
MSDLSITNKLKKGILAPYVGNDIVTATPGQRIVDAAGQALLGVAVTALARKGYSSFIAKHPSALKGLVQMIKPGLSGLGEVVKPRAALDPMLISRDAAMGTISGLFARDIHNALVRHKHKKISDTELNKTMNKGGTSFKQVLLDIKAGLGGDIATGVKALGRGLLPMGGGPLGRASMRAVGRTKPFPVSQRVFGWGVKGAAGIGAYKGISAASGAMDNAQNFKANQYTTALRNNMLAGNVSPAELSVPDMESVRKQGMT